jgi:hypothetical protein
MTITSYIDKAKDLTVFKVNGDLTFDKIMPIVKAFYDGDPTMHVLWDLLDTTDIQLTSEEVETIAKFNPRFGGKRASGKTTFVAQKDILFGLSRMFEIQSDLEGAPFPIMVFRTMDEAHQWLDEP